MIELPANTPLWAHPLITDWHKTERTCPSCKAPCIQRVFRPASIPFQTHCPKSGHLAPPLFLGALMPEPVSDWIASYCALRDDDPPDPEEH